MNKLTSVKAQLPLPYYSAPFPKPTDVNEESNTIISDLLGNKIENSQFTLVIYLY